MHGLCGPANMNSPCIFDEGLCVKHFPKRFIGEITIDNDGYLFTGTKIMEG